MGRRAVLRVHRRLATVPIMAPAVLDNARTRGLYPALAHRQLYFDSPGGALPPDLVLRAMVATVRASLTRPGAAFARSRNTGLLEQHSRAAVADLVGADPADVILGPDVATLLERIAQALSRSWRLSDQILLSRLDREDNVRPWLSAAKPVGVQPVFAQVDVETCELPAWQYKQLLTPRTRLVALPGASGAVGTCPDVAAIAAAAHEVGALVVVDASALAPHAALDLAELGADVLALSADAFGGPRVAALVGAPGVWARIGSDWPGGPLTRFERDGVAPEHLSGLIAAIDHLADLVPGTGGDRRTRLLGSMGAVQSYGRSLFDPFVASLKGLDKVTVVCATDPDARIPVLQLAIDGRPGRWVAQALAKASIAVWDGDAQAPALMADLGATDAFPGGMVSIGLMPYTSVADLRQLLAAIASIAQ